MISWRDIKSSDDRDMWHYQEEQTALEMRQIALNIWKDKEKAEAWLKYANDHRLARWPKDRTFEPLTGA